MILEIKMIIIQVCMIQYITSNMIKIHLVKDIVNKEWQK